MARWQQVTIVGTGLIGGSIGIDLLRRELAQAVVGVGRRAESLAEALRVGAATRTTTDLADGVAEADLVIVCTPVGRIVGDVQAVFRHIRHDALVTDAGSTKASIVAELTALLPAGSRFVGSHPLAGGERSGPSAALANLFDGRTVVITPGPRTVAEDEQAVESFWQALGARTVRMSPEAHDRALAVTSHLPHLAASILAATTDDEFLPLVARGWLDTTRVAAGDPELWRQIVAANPQPIAAALSRMIIHCEELQTAIESADWPAVEQLLARGKQQRDRAASNGGLSQARRPHP